MFVQSAEFVKAHGGKRTDISVYGQEFTDTTWKLAKMNLALRGIEADLGDRSADSFSAGPASRPAGRLRAREPAVQRQRTGGTRSSPTTPAGSTARRRRATRTSPGCSTSSITCPREAQQASSSRTDRCHRKSGGEGEIRRKLVEADLVDCIVAMPDKLFFNTGIPVSLWFVSKDRHGNGHRKRRWRSAIHRRPKARPHGDPPLARARRRRHRQDRRYLPRVGATTMAATRTCPASAKASTLDEIKHTTSSSPGRYVGAEEAES